MKKLPVIFLLSLFAVSGCGQKGALYIPGSPEAEDQVEQASETKDEKSEEESGAD